MPTLKDLCNNISHWKPATLNEVAERVNRFKAENKPPTPPGLYMDISQDIPIVDIYSYLHSRFGPPNGFQMHLKNPNDVDNLIHWEYELRYEDAYIHFTGFFFHFSVLIGGLSESASDQNEYFHEFLKEIIQKNISKIQQQKNVFEEWLVFSNPYFQFADMVEELIDEIQADTELVRFGQRPADVSLIECKAKSNSQIFKQLFRRKITLKLIIPIWIESFINLVIFVCSKPDFRQLEEEFSNYKKSQWRNRVRNLHTHCLGFLRPIDMNAPQLKKIEPLFSTRNRLLHGAIAPEISGKKIYFADRFIPLMAECSYMTDFLHDISLHGLDTKDLDKEIEAAQEFISYVIESLDPDMARLLVRLMNESNPGWDTKRLKAGAILPPIFVDSFLQFKKETST